MHTYRRPDAAECLRDPASIGDFVFNDALDVVAWAERDATIGWKTWPEAWHLDESGVFRCYYKASSLDSIRTWAKSAGGLWQSRREGRANGGCVDRWVIVESRPTWLHEPPTVDEGDAAAFITVHRKIRRIGVELVDTVIFDDEGHWWSMHELTSGTTRWSSP